MLSLHAEQIFHTEIKIIFQELLVTLRAFVLLKYDTCKQPIGELLIKLGSAYNDCSSKLSILLASSSLAKSVYLLIREKLDKFVLLYRRESIKDSTQINLQELKRVVDESSRTLSASRDADDLQLAAGLMNASVPLSALIYKLGLLSAHFNPVFPQQLRFLSHELFTSLQKIYTETYD